ncbi:MAG TPA: hypothetical protein PLY09_01705 [Methanothrix sp.]|nr:hypothetical protein [Methanothrix sp.]
MSPFDQSRGSIRWRDELEMEVPDHPKTSILERVKIDARSARS